MLIINWLKYSTKNNLISRTTISIIFFVFCYSQSNSQTLSFNLDSIYNSGDTIYRVSTGQSHDVWYSGGIDSNQLYRLDSGNITNYSTLFQDSSTYAIQDLYSTGEDSCLISTYGDGMFYMRNGNLFRLNVSNGLSSNYYTNFTGYGEIFNSFVFPNYYKIATCNSKDVCFITVDFGNNFVIQSPSSGYDTINRIESEIGNTGIGANYGPERFEISHVSSNGIWRHETITTSSAFHHSYLPHTLRSKSATYWTVPPGNVNFKTFFATNNGLRVIQDNSPSADSLFIPGVKVHKVLKYYKKNMDAGCVLAGTDDGLYVINKLDWSVSKINLGFNCRVFDIAKEESCLWLATDTGLIKLRNTDCGYSSSYIKFGEVQADANDSCFIPISLNCSNCIESVTWNFGDTTSSNNFQNNHYYQNSGNYTVSAIISNGFCIDTILSTINIELCCSPSYYPNITFTDDTICQFDTVSIIPNINNDYYLWLSDSSTNNYISPDSIGLYNVIVTSDFGCMDTGTVNIQFHPISNNFLPADTGLCLGNSIYFQLDTMGFTNITWLDSINNDNLLVDSSGNYNVYYVDTSGCINNDTVIVYSLPFNPVTLGSDTSNCYDYTLNAGNTYLQYLWSDLSSNDTLLVDTSGTYWVEVTDTNSCVYTDSINVVIFSPEPIDLGNDTTFCSNETLHLYTSNLNTQWSNGIINDTIVPDTSGIYTAFYIDSTGCGVKGAILVTIQPEHIVNLELPDNYCLGDSITLSLNFSSANYLWQDSTSSSNYITDHSELIWANVTIGSCSVTDSIITIFDSSPEAPLSNEWKLCNDSNKVISINDSGYTYLWSTGEISSSIEINNPGEYSVLVSNGSCTKEFTFNIDDCDATVSIPNTITPNGDGYNDTWIIDNIDQFPNHLIEVFNRNGSVVFLSSNYKNDWNGTYNGNELPATTYYYVIDLGIGEGVLKGDLTIIRE